MSAGRSVRSILSGAATAAPDFFLGLACLALLVDRGLLPGMALPLARAVPVEFAVIHASGFLAVPWVARWADVGRRARYTLLLAAGYSALLGVASLIAGGAWPLAIFWSLMVNRMLGVIVGDLPGEDTLRDWGMAWAGTTALFVGAVAVSALGAEAWLTRAYLAGFLYFTMVGLSELTGWRWVYRWMRTAPPAASPPPARTRRRA